MHVPRLTRPASVSAIDVCAIGTIIAHSWGLAANIVGLPAARRFSAVHVPILGVLVAPNSASPSRRSPGFTSGWPHGCWLLRSWGIRTCLGGLGFNRCGLRWGSHLMIRFCDSEWLVTQYTQLDKDRDYHLLCVDQISPFDDFQFREPPPLPHPAP